MEITKVRDLGKLIETMLPPTKLAKYPHMFTKDIEIWERYLEHHAKDYIGFMYDLKVGDGTEPMGHVKEPYVGMQAMLSKYRIDVVGIKTNTLEIIEVKPMAGTGAIGQAMSYYSLFVKEYHPIIHTVAFLLTDYERPNVRELANHFQMRYHIS